MKHFYDELQESKVAVSTREEQDQIIALCKTECLQVQKKDEIYTWWLFLV